MPPASPVEIRTSFDRETHTYYREILDHPPEGVAFRPLPSRWGHTAPGGRSGTLAFWKARAAWQLAGGVNVDAWPRKLMGEGPLLAAQTLPLHRVPWALDVDVVSALTGFRHRDIRRAANRALLRRRLHAGDCRAIAYWSEAARRGMEAYLPGLAEKGVVVYPSVEAPPPRARAATDDVHVLFVGKAFDMKGGPEAMEAARRLLVRHRRGVRFTFVTNLPPGFPVPDEPRIRVASRLPQDELDALWRDADVFLFPTLYEVFGVVVVEAMAHGLPVVTLDEFAIPEAVHDGVEGRLVRGYPQRWYDARMLPLPLRWETLRATHVGEERERVVADLTEALDALVRDPALRARMGAAGRRACTEGPFSRETQHRALRTVVERLVA